VDRLQNEAQEAADCKQKRQEAESGVPSTEAKRDRKRRRESKQLTTDARMVQLQRDAFTEVYSPVVVAKLHAEAHPSGAAALAVAACVDESAEDTMPLSASGLSSADSKEPAAHARFVPLVSDEYDMYASRLPSRELQERWLKELSGRTNHSRIRCRVFADLFDRRFTVTIGMTFGGDFLVYEADPSSAHATYVCVVCTSTPPTLHSTKLSAVGRLANAVGKGVLFAWEDPSDKQINYMTARWTAFDIMTDATL